MNEPDDPRRSPSALRLRIEALEVALEQIARRSAALPREWHNWREWRREGIALETAHAAQRVMEDIGCTARDALQGYSYKSRRNIGE